jgi:hypothetical protein
MASTSNNVDTDTIRSRSPRRELTTKKQISNMFGQITKKFNSARNARSSANTENVSNNEEEVEEIISIMTERYNQFLDESDTYAGTLNEEQKADFSKWLKEKAKLYEDYIKELRALFSTEPMDTNEDRHRGDDDVHPNDSASNVSHASLTSTLVRQRAAKRRAELLIAKRTLEQKAKLEEQQRALEHQLQLLDLDAELAKERAEELIQDQIESGATVFNIDGIQNEISSASEFNRPLSNGSPMNADQRQQMDDLGRVQAQSISMLAKQQMVALLPKRDIDVFAGDPLKYKSFVRAFEHSIEEKTESSKDRLHYLEQFTSGKAQELVRSCGHMEPEEGYKTARQLLKKRFGDEYLISNGYAKKATEWPVIKSEDAKAMDEFALFLRSCLNAMRDVKYLDQLDNPERLQMLVLKLPFDARRRWRKKFIQARENDNRLLQFKEFVEFVEEESLALNDPIFGCVQDNRNQEKKKEQDKPKKATNKNTVLVTTIKDKGSKCDFCQNTGHSLQACKEIKERSLNERKDFIKKKGLCFACLSSGHMSKFCQNRATCSECGRRHPTILHDPEKDKSDTEVTNACVMKKESRSHTGAGARRNCIGVSVAIVPVDVFDGIRSRSARTYATQDPCSTASFITEDLVKQLGLKTEKTQMRMTTMEKRSSLIKTEIVKKLKVRGRDETKEIELPLVYVRKELPVTEDDLPNMNVSERWEHLKDIPFEFEERAPVGLLIGMDVPEALKPLEVVSGNEEEPYAVRTALGWSLNGPLESKKNNVLVNRIKVEPRNLEQMLQQMYDHDFQDVNSSENKISMEDRKWKEKVESSITYKEGHYQIDLPFRDDNVNMPFNKELAIKRLNGLKKKFKKDELYKQEYVEFIRKMEDNGYIERVLEEESTLEKGKIWYIPHHGVYHPRKRKIRVVFDCSAEYGGTSLNKELLQGPDMLNSLFGVLVRFREERIAFMADVEAMFHQVRVPEKDVNFLRFLWWPEGDEDREPVEYRVRVHLFGATSSPSCANFALKRTAEEHGVSALAIECVKNNFYVDDCLKSTSDVRTAANLMKEVKTTCSLGGFKLTKFVCNDSKALSELNPADLMRKKEDVNLNMEQGMTEKALGVTWNIKEDTFQYKIDLVERPSTRRGLLSMLSSIYDPLGFISPILLPVRVILQECARDGIGWDQQISQEQKERWSLWQHDLIRLQEFQVERCMRPNEDIKEVRLHHFADASEKGYGTVSYLRYVTNAGGIHVAIVAAKSRVSPLKKSTVPRLELTAAKLAADMDRQLRQELSIELKESVFWTDSTTVLKYLTNDQRRLHRFEANRVQAIRLVSKVTQWHHVTTKSNPADLASRGCSVDQLLTNKLWKTGPWFLWQPRGNWDDEAELSDLKDDDPGVKKIVKVNALQIREDPILKLSNRCSSWIQLKKRVAWLLRTKDRLLKRSVPSSCITVEEMKNAENVIIRAIQRRYFQSDPKISRKPWYKKLCVFTDEEGLLRVGGRLRNSELTSEAKHPLLLPKESDVSEMIARHFHVLAGHLGLETTRCLVQQEFWILNATKTLKRLIKSCLKCQKYQAKVGEQYMSDLPSVRVQSERPPFFAVGIDYFGPFEIKRGRSVVKRWCCLFSCLKTRATHLEVVHSMDTSSFVNALRRFIARRGNVQEIWSDNGTNFKGAERELKEAISNWNQNQIYAFLLQKKIKWTFNPPLGSHHGGVWERQIRTIRKVMSAVLTEQNNLDDERFETLMCEVEFIMNSRPLTTVSSDPNDLEPLTPNMLLNLKSDRPLPPDVFEKTDNHSRKRWRQVQYLADLFWKRWRREYLSSLQERQKWTNIRRNLQVNDLVLLVDEMVPRGQWSMGRVIETYPDSQGLVRKIKVRRCNKEQKNSDNGDLKTTDVVRPIDKVCLILESFC